MDTLAQSLAERVLIARRRLGMNQVEFAQKLRNDGLHARRWTAADISELENEKLDPRLSELADLSHATGIEIRDLISVMPLYLNRNPISDLDPINLGVTDPDWFSRDPIMHLPNPGYWSKPLQSETLPIKVAS